jgi:hypothetical protein
MAQNLCQALLRRELGGHRHGAQVSQRRRPAENHGPVLAVEGLKRGWRDLPNAMGSLARCAGRRLPTPVPRAPIEP